MLRSMLMWLTIAATGIVSACDARSIQPERELETLAMTADADPKAELVARQHELLQILERGDADRLADMLDLSFTLYDHARPPATSAAPVGADYVSWIRDMPGLNYYQFLAGGIPQDVEWSGRTIEIIWTTPTVALVATHRNESDPVFTEWKLTDGAWKATRLTIHAQVETLRAGRRSRPR